MPLVSSILEVMRAVIVLVLILAFGAAAGCSSPAAVRASAEKTPTVVTARVERHQLDRELTLSGEFVPNQEVDLHSKVAGFLRSITVDVGDRVSAGQVIATLEVPELAEDLEHATATERRSEIDVGRARSMVAQAESKMKIQELSYRRLSEVAKAKPNLVAQHELDNALALYNEARAQLEAARVGTALAEEQVRVSASARNRIGTLMGYLKITAPFDGIVTRRYADPGAMIQAGTASQTQAKPLVRVAQVRRLRLVLPIPESAVPSIHVGTPVEIRVDSLQRIVQGRVVRYSGQVDDESRTMRTEVDLDNTEGVLKPGMFAHATIRLERRANALAVPVQSVRHIAGGQRLAFIVNRERRVERRSIQTGMETPYLIEVLSGVSAGEQVIVGSGADVQPGETVNAKVLPKAQLEGGR